MKSSSVPWLAFPDLGGRPGARYRPRVDGEWSGWWPSVVALVLGLVVLGLVSAFVVRRALRAEREFAGFRADVRAAMARLRADRPAR
jgi:hypothetical protein